MRGGNKVGRSKQRRFTGGFVDEHVERRAADLAAVQRVLECRLVYQATACAIDDPHAPLGLRQILAAQNIARLIGQRGMQGDEIGLGQQRIEIGLFDAQFDRTFGGEEGIVGDDLHLQPQRAIGNDRADIARADQAECLAGQLDAHEAVLFPLSGLGRRVGLGQLPGEREHQRDGVFGGGDRIPEWRVHHHHALRGGSGDIDIVDADAGAANDLEVGRRGQDLLRHLGRGADCEAIIFVDPRDKLILGFAGDLVDLDPAFAEDLGGERRHFVGNQDFWHFRPFVAPSLQEPHLQEMCRLTRRVRQRVPRPKPNRARVRAPRCPRCRPSRRTRYAGPAGRRDSRRCRMRPLPPQAVRQTS